MNVPENCRIEQGYGRMWVENETDAARVEAIIQLLDQCIGFVVRGTEFCICFWNSREATKFHHAITQACFEQGIPVMCATYCYADPVH